MERRPVCRPRGPRGRAPRPETWGARWGVGCSQKSLGPPHRHGAGVALGHFLGDGGGRGFLRTLLKTSSSEPQGQVHQITGDSHLPPESSPPPGAPDEAGMPADQWKCRQGGEQGIDHPLPSQVSPDKRGWTPTSIHSGVHGHLGEPGREGLSWDAHTLSPQGQALPVAGRCDTAVCALRKPSPMGTTGHLCQGPVTRETAVTISSA